MEFEYKENILTVDDYIIFDKQMGDSPLTREQAERSVTNQLFSMEMEIDIEVGGF